MTQYSILVNKKGTILSFKVADADPSRFPVKNLIGKHFSRLIGTNCKKDLHRIMQEASKTSKPGNFTTFLPARGTSSGPVVEWTVQPKSGNILDMLLPARYLLIGRATA